jgi:glycopeptide antibiotics resistance protein
MKGWQQPTSGHKTTPTVRIKRVFSVVILGSLAIVLYLSLYPFTFEQFGRIAHLPSYISGFRFPTYTRCCTHLAVLEPLANVLLYLPLGFGLAGRHGQASARGLVILARALLLSLGLSLMVEVLQVFQPWRSPSLADVLMNSLGGGLGGLFYLAGCAGWNAFRHRTRY